MLMQRSMAKISGQIEMDWTFSPEHREHPPNSKVQEACREQMETVWQKAAGRCLKVEPNVEPET